MTRLGLASPRWRAFALTVAGAIMIGFSIQICTWHGRGSWVGDPRNKIFVASWLASEMWVNPVLLGAGALLVLSGVAYMCWATFRVRRERTQQS